MSALSLGFSPCPNDTFAFAALVRGLIPGAPTFAERLEDIETLNHLAMNEKLDVAKVSFHALAHLRNTYCLLHAGGALGRGCGPLVVAREEVEPADLHARKIAAPGKLTTAVLLLRLFDPRMGELVLMPFHRIMDAIRAGEVDAGLIIHESRFTYPHYGLKQVMDLGHWWEEETGHPIPLGGIVARRALGAELIGAVNRGLRASVEYARAYPERVMDYVAAHAQELDPQVMQAHIDLYVNEHTLDYGPSGEVAIADLLARAAWAGVAPQSELPLFATA
ncbi:MAG: 1,4-dihydroxy-6-naphthoate synthase [Candidatus Handelsmanbacteria bacterium]|nr:1,4-dihydroxy-6-naphthoate synthase [Candidatus Handelsmanbacteria bacterium]